MLAAELEDFTAGILVRGLVCGLGWMYSVFEYKVIERAKPAGPLNRAGGTCTVGEPRKQAVNAKRTLPRLEQSPEALSVQICYGWGTGVGDFRLWGLSVPIPSFSLSPIA